MPRVMAIVLWPRRSWTTLGWMPCSRARGGPGVAETLQGEGRQAQLPRAALEGVARAFGAEAPAVGAMEHETLVGEVGAGEHALLEHPLAVGSEHCHRLRIEGDRPAATGGLRFADRDLASHGDDRPHNSKSGGVEVDVGPAEAERLAPARSIGDGETGSTYARTALDTRWHRRCGRTRSSDGKPPAESGRICRPGKTGIPPRA